MEKAVDRQRVLLRHLDPAASPAASVVSVRILFPPPLCCFDRPPDLCLADGGRFLCGWQATPCAAGDSAAYHRRPAFADDVVIVA